MLDLEAEYSETLHCIATSVKRLASADVVTAVRPTDDDPSQLEVVVATGAAERELVGVRYLKDDSLPWQAMQQQGHGVRVGSLDRHADICVHLRPYVPVSQAMALRSEVRPVRGGDSDGPDYTAHSLHRCRP